MQQPVRAADIDQRALPFLGRTRKICGTNRNVAHWEPSKELRMRMILQGGVEAAPDLAGVCRISCISARTTGRGQRPSSPRTSLGSDETGRRDTGVDRRIDKKECIALLRGYALTRALKPLAELVPLRRLDDAENW